MNSMTITSQEAADCRFPEGPGGLRSSGGEGSGEKGASKAGVLLLLLVGGVFLYFGYQTLTFYISYYDLIGHMEAQAQRADEKSDAEIRTYLEEQINGLGIPADAKELRINRRGRNIEIGLDYDEVLTLDLGDDYYYELWFFEFSPRVVKPISGTPGRR